MSRKVIFHETCEVCGDMIGASDVGSIGFVRAVHLHDEHPEAFMELAEHARAMLDSVDEAMESPVEEGSPA